MNSALLRLRTSWLVGIVLLGLTVPATAQENKQDPPVEPTTVPTAEVQPQITAASVEADLAEIEANGGIEDAVKDLLRPKYKQAIEDLKTSEANSKLADEYRASIESGPTAAEQLRQQLEQTPLVEESDAFEVSGTIAEMQAELDAKKAAHNLLTGELSKTNENLTKAKDRAGQLAPRISEIGEELDRLRPQLDAANQADDGSSPGRKADRLELQATEMKLASELEMLKQEQASQSAREGLLTARRDLLIRQVENSTSEYKPLEREVLSRLTEKASQEINLENLPMDDADVAALVEEVRAVRGEFRDVVESRKLVVTAQENIAKRLGELQDEKRDVIEQIQLGGAGEVLSQILFNLESQIVNPDQLERELLSDVPSIDQTRIAAIRVDRKIRGIALLREQFAEYSQSVTDLLETRQTELRNLRDQYEQLRLQMIPLEKNRAELLTEADSLRELISNRLFWLRTAPPISTQTFANVPNGLAWLGRPEHWQECGSALARGVTATPLTSIVVIALAVGLLLARPRISTALDETGVKTRRISTDRYRWTWEALGWTALLVLPVPLLFGFAGWKLIIVPGASDWLRGLSYGLRSASWVVLDVALVAAVVRPGGLGEAHFRWKNVPQKRIRQTAWAFGVVYVPAAILTSSTLFNTSTQYAVSIGRLAFIAAQFWTGLMVWWLFSSSEGVLALWNQANPGNEKSRLRSFWFVLLLACPLVLAALACGGYLIMAIELLFGFGWSLATVAYGVLVYWMILRWFFIKTRRLALAEAMEKRQARLAAAEESESADGEIVTVAEEDGGSLDLGSISAQTRHVVRMLISVVVALVLVAFWSETFPLIDELRKVPFLGNLSLLDAGSAILILVISSIVIRNLPGLLELTILRQKSIDKGTRYATVRLCQYFLIAVAMGLLFYVLKVDWSQFGWIAAALSVGLGFGLQEVVANFICGLILLFERPIRVGDVVTLENVTGTVTRIHMRSTTITNWDRQDLVVPNKNLITGTILNWTLSASINRIVIPVGVAYGTDTDEARQILLDVAARHPTIVDEPPPMATFDEFADSSLLLTLRAYLPDMDNRLKTITDLHTEIDKRFAAAGIEIAFPQLDMHLHTEGKTASQPFAADFSVDA